jgi:MFS family permease
MFTTMASESMPPTHSFGRRAGAFTFGAIFALESLVRAFNATVISLLAYELLAKSQRVSMLSTVVSLTVLCTTLSLPYVLGRLRRRWAYSIGIACMIMAALLLASYTIPGLALGMYLRNCGAAIMNVTLSLYIMDHIKRSELARTEPIRLSASTLSWTLGPYSGVWLYTHYGAVAPQLASIAAALALLLLFWILRLSDPTTLPSGTYTPFNPLSNLARFVAQPRLRLAWMIAFGRSCFWSTFFIYGPILVVESGLPKTASGLLISASQLLLLSAYGFGRIAYRTGVRPVIAGCFLVLALSSLGAGVAGTAHPYVSFALLLLGSLAASGLDAVGGIPFLRAVKPYERQRMAPVYRTFIDLSDLLPAIVYSVALMFFEVHVVFILLAASLALMGLIAYRYLPRSL